MSYASVTAHNAPPISKQPKPDPALLNTTAPGYTTGVADDTAKVNVVGPDFKRNPVTVTSETDPLTENDYYYDDGNVNGSAKRKARVGKEKAKVTIGKAEREGVHLWGMAKEQLLRPGVAGGLMGVVNVGLLSWASYALYTNPPLRRDTKFLTSSAAAALVLLGAEGYAAEQYAQTPSGQEEKRRAKEEGAAIYRHTHEVILRPGVLGGLVGLANIGVLGTVSYFAYVNWDMPRWDRKVISAVSVGLLTLWSGEGFVAEKYRESRRY